MKKMYKKIQKKKTHPDPALAYGIFDICGKNSAKLIVKNNVPKGTRASISVSVIDIASKLILVCVSCYAAATAAAGWLAVLVSCFRYYMSP